MNASVERLGMLAYGSVELCLCDVYIPGDVIAVDHRIRLEVVDQVEKADGIIVLGLVPRGLREHPSCLCVLFTHYVRRLDRDLIDHGATIIYLRRPSEAVRKLSEMAFCGDLQQRCATSSVMYTPSMRYL